YQAVLLYRAALEERAPNAVRSMLRIQRQVDAPTMIELSAKVRRDRQPESRVAAEFVRSRWGVLAHNDEESTVQRLTRTTAEHLFLVAISLAAAIAVAIPLGVAAAYHPRLGQWVLSLVGVVQTLPSMALLVFMIPLFGLGPRPAIAALFLYSLLPIVRNTHSGLCQIPQALRESAEVLGLSSWARLRLVDIPLAMPSILAGIKTAAVINVGTATIGALIGAGGYGAPILTGIRLSDFGLILQGALPAAMLALLVQYAFGVIERWGMPPSRE
ncbi:MAG TPA: ABC transporter permease subunit, partial [Pirellulaceae bacterium]